MPTPVPNVATGDLLTEAWGDAVRLAVTELQTAPPAHGSTHQPAGSDAIPTAAAGVSAVGDTAAAGTSTSLSRADHRHARESFGGVAVAAAGDAATNGTSVNVSHADHKHGLPVAAPSAIGNANAAGSSGSVARADHVHAAAGDGLQAVTGNTGALAAGASTTLTLNWPVTFGSTPTYVLASVLFASADIVAPTWFVRSISATQVGVRVTNNDISTRTLFVHALGIK